MSPTKPTYQQASTTNEDFVIVYYNCCVALHALWTWVWKFETSLRAHIDHPQL